MEGGVHSLDTGLDRRGQRITELMRWFALGSGLVGVILAWDSPKVRPWHALGVIGVSVVYALAARTWLRHHPAARQFRFLHAVLDAFAIGIGGLYTGGIESLFWLFFYPHVLTCSVRGGLVFGIAMGALDAGFVLWLDRLGPSHPLAAAHAAALLLCAIVGAITGSYLRRIRSGLRGANQALAAKNEELSLALAAHETTRQQQAATIERLRESEERYRRLVQRIQDGVVIVRNGTVLYANDVFGQMVGALPEDLVGLDMTELVTPEDRQDVSDRYRRWEGVQGQAGAFETRVRMRDGSTLVVSVKVGALEFEGQRAVIATVRDITRERQMEQEIKAHAERLVAINELAGAINLSLTVEDIVRVASHEARRLLPFDRLTLALLEDEGSGLEVVAADAKPRRVGGLRRDEAAWAFRRPCAWCDGDEDPPPPPRAAELLAEPQIRALATVPLLSKDRTVGALCLGRLQAQPFSSWDLGVMEPVARHIALAVDNARLLEALRRSSRELQSVLEVGRGIGERIGLAELLPLVTRSVNRVMGTRHCILMLRSGDMLEVVAQEGLETDVLGSVGRLRIGQSLSGWVAQHGRPLAVAQFREDPRAEFLDVAERYGYEAYLGVPLMRGSEVLGTLEVITKEPRRFGHEEQELMAAFAAEAAVALDNARLLESARSHLAQLEAANRRLEELDRLRQEYLRNVSHEFRTPLTVIKGYAEYLLTDAEQDPAAVRDVMRIIVESCDRVIDLVETLIEVSRVEQGTAEQELRREPVDLRDVAANAADLLRQAALKKGIDVILEFPQEPLRLYGDAGLLQQLVKKLVDNALKYSPSGSRVVLKGRPEEESLTLEVEDSGIGIPAEHLPRIFEKFYMVDGGIARRVGGTGVGLYLVREIARLHNGTVEVQSAPGKGSVFSVRLPRGAGTAPRGLPA
jgi:PAS domain S-box-containing protein